MMRHLSHTLVLFVLSALVGVFFGMPVGMSAMEHHERAPMAGCTFMLNHSAPCTMSALGHVASWQAAMVGLLPEMFVLLVLVALLAADLWGHRDRYSVRRAIVPPTRTPDATPLFLRLLLGIVMSPRAP